MSQKAINAAWQHNVSSSIGTIGILAPPAIPTTLKRPYQYQAPMAVVLKLQKDIKSITTPYSKQLQCLLAETKPVKYGVRYSVWFLGYHAPLSGGSTGISKKEWAKLTADTVKALATVCPDPQMYIEPYNKTRKFQARFDTYIMYSEMAE